MTTKTKDKNSIKILYELLKKYSTKNEILENIDDDENEIFIKNIKEELKSEKNKQNMRDKFKILEIEKGTKQIRL